MSNIKHSVSGVTVFSTDQYKLFDMINGNRGINQIKMNKIIKEIESGNDMLKYYPIQVRVVNNKMEILDGQHRYLISKKLKRPVHYIVVTEEKTMSDIAKVNSNVEKWTPKDFLNCYINKGGEHYVNLQKFITEFDLTISTATTLLHSGSPISKGKFDVPMDHFRNGTFEIKEGLKARNLVKASQKFSDFPFWSTPAFMRAIEKITVANLVPLEDIVQNYKRFPEMLTRQASYKQYIINLEQILNHKKSKRSVIA